MIPKIFLFALVAIALPTISVAAPNQTAYELKQRCGEQASSEFKREWGSGVSDTKEGSTLSSFRNHYNKNLNSCFYLLTTRGFSRDSEGKPSRGYQSQTLYDLNDNHEIGTLWKFDDPVQPTLCQVKEMSCRNLAEFNRMIKQFMED
jgi:hypothetical protein